MKKLILILLFLPMFCSSQVIIKNTERMCIVTNISNVNEFDCIEVTGEGMIIYIDKDILTFKLKGKIIEEFPVDSYYVDKLNNKSNVFDVLVGSEIKTVCIIEDDICQVLSITSQDKKFKSIFYEYKKALN